MKKLLLLVAVIFALITSGIAQTTTDGLLDIGNLMKDLEQQ